MTLLEKAITLTTYDERLAWYHTLSEVEKKELAMEVTEAASSLAVTFKSIMDEIQQALTEAISGFVELYQVYGYPLPESKESKR